MQKQRLRKLQQTLNNPILIKKKENLFYLTGRSFDYRAEEYLLVTKRNVIGFGSGFEQIDWVKKSDRLKNIGKYISGNKLDLEWGFTYGEGEYIKFKLKNPPFLNPPPRGGRKVGVRPARSQVDEMRQVKEPSELSHIRKSMQIVERVFERVKKELRSRSWTEKGLAEFITKTGYKFGAGDISFPAIVASGSNAAIPHHVPSNKKLKAGESIIIDFGFKYRHYCSDFTRTVFLKRAPLKLEKAYNWVEKAYLESMRFIESPFPSPSHQGRGTRRFPPREGKGGVMAGEVYQKCVEVLAEAKLDKYFIHSLGHGTGLEIHELPNLSPNSKDLLMPGMVFSIEPGVYMPNLGGIRIEDLVYLEKGKVKKFINVTTGLRDNIIH
jgi:Xaa-Pro aminopeptidase